MNLTLRQLSISILDFVMCLNHERAQPRGEGQCMRQVQKKERMHTSGLGPETHVFGAPMMQSSAPKSNELYPWYSSPAQACLAGTDEVGLLLHRTLKARLGPFMQLHVHGSNSGEVAGPGVRLLLKSCCGIIMMRRLPQCFNSKCILLTQKNW